MSQLGKQLASFRGTAFILPVADLMHSFLFLENEETYLPHCPVSLNRSQKSMVGAAPKTASEISGIGHSRTVLTHL